MYNECLQFIYYNHLLAFSGRGARSGRSITQKNTKLRPESVVQSRGEMYTALLYLNKLTPRLYPPCENDDEWENSKGGGSDAEHHCYPARQRGRDWGGGIG